jgi:hypothetical protein
MGTADYECHAEGKKNMKETEEEEDSWVHRKRQTGLIFDDIKVVYGLKRDEVTGGWRQLHN